MLVLLLFQVLITKQDVRDKYSLDNLRSTVEELISMNCVPIINENDVVASPPDLDCGFSRGKFITVDCFFNLNKHIVLFVTHESSYCGQP